MGSSYGLPVQLRGRVLEGSSSSEKAVAVRGVVPIVLGGIMQCECSGVHARKEDGNR